MRLKGGPALGNGQLVNISDQYLRQRMEAFRQWDIRCLGLRLTDQRWHECWGVIELMALFHLHLKLKNKWAPWKTSARHAGADKFIRLVVVQDVLVCHGGPGGPVTSSPSGLLPVNQGCSCQRFSTQRSTVTKLNSHFACRKAQNSNSPVSPGNLKKHGFEKRA